MISFVDGQRVRRNVHSTVNIINTTRAARVVLFGTISLAEVSDAMRILIIVRVRYVVVSRA